MRLRDRLKGLLFRHWLLFLLYLQNGNNVLQTVVDAMMSFGEQQFIFMAQVLHFYHRIFYDVFLSFYFLLIAIVDE